MLVYVVNVFSQSHCFERFLVVYAAGRPPTANQMPKFRSISEIINPLLIEAQFVFAKTGNFCKNREFLQILENFCKNRDFFAKTGIFRTGFLTGFFYKTGISYVLFYGFFRYKSQTFSRVFYVNFYVFFHGFSLGIIKTTSTHPYGAIRGR